MSAIRSRRFAVLAAAAALLAPMAGLAADAAGEPADGAAVTGAPSPDGPSGPASAERPSPGRSSPDPSFSDGPAGIALDGGGGLWAVRTAEVWPAGTVALQAVSLLYRLEAGTVPGDDIDHDVTDAAFQLAAGFGWGEAWVIGRGARHAAGADAETFAADGAAGVKLRSPVSLPGTRAALLLEAGLPTGDRARGGSTDSFDPGVAALLTAPLPLPGRDVRARIHLNAGYRRRGDGAGRVFAGTPAYYLAPAYPAGDADRIDLRGAMEVRGQGVSLFLELVLDKLRGEGVAWSEGPRFLDMGFRMATGWGTSVVAGARATLAVDDVSTTGRYADDLYPDWQAGFALAWARRPEGP